MYRMGKTAVAVMFLVMYNLAVSQDTLKVNLRDSEKIFVEKNLLLLASQYNVGAQKALIIQAKLWDNPRFSTEINLYNPEGKKAFDAGKNGEKTFALEQVLYIGGKKKFEVELAKQNAGRAELELQDLLRNLRLQLRRNFYTIVFNNLTLDKYTKQLQLLSEIIWAYDEQGAKGNISMKEVLRLKAVYYQLNNDKTELLNNTIDAQTVLQTLLGTNQAIVPFLDSMQVANYKLPVTPVDVYISQAMQNRPDYKIAQSIAQSAETNLKWQRRQAVPDLTLGGAYDQRGGAFQNQVGLTLGIDLPVWNRNQGNIKYAKEVIKATQTIQQNKTVELTNEVQNALAKLKRVEQEFQTVDKTYSSDYTKLNDGVIENFQKRNISLLEFVDFFESYNESIDALNKLRKARIDAYEELNAAVGTELFNNN